MVSADDSHRGHWMGAALAITRTDHMARLFNPADGVK
jgi:hypothetical protein